MKKNKSGKESREYWSMELTILNRAIGKFSSKRATFAQTWKRRESKPFGFWKKSFPGRGNSKSMALRKEDALAVKGTVEANAAGTEWASLSSWKIYIYTYVINT